MSDINLDKIEKNLLEKINSEIEFKQKDGLTRNLYISYYNDCNINRQKEIDLCIRLNILNQLFDKIYIFDETNTLKSTERVSIIPVKSRLTFNDFFVFANIYSEEDTLNFLINTDIVFGEGFGTLRLEKDQFICLSRYEVDMDGNYSIKVGGGSHDCWIWRGRIKDGLGNFYMGKFLCDGVLASELREAGYKLKNPVYGLKIYHIHMSEIRNYGYHDLICGNRNGIIFSHNDGIFNNNDVYNDGRN